MLGKAFRRYWKRWAGAPKTIVSDGGPEFGAGWTDHLAGDGTEHAVAAAYAPWQNGVCERLGGAWKVAFSKSMLECDPQSKEETEELCDQLNCAHNTMTRVDGFSPHQHVLGADLRVPVLGMLGEGNETQESALHEKEERHMKAQKIRLAARKAFLDADSESKLKRAISHGSRPNRGPFEVGDQVMMWREHHWHGPGRVIGTQTEKIWVMYGAKVYRCAPEQVKHVDSEIVELSAWLPITLRNWKSTIRERGAGNLVELDKERFPPPEEQEVREEAEHEAQDGQGVQGGSEDVDMEQVEQLVVPGVNEQEGASDMLRDGGGAQQEPVEAMNVPSPAGSEQQGPMSVDEPAAEPPGSDTHMDAPAGAWTMENTQYGPVRT